MLEPLTPGRLTAIAGGCEHQHRLLEDRPTRLAEGACGLIVRRVVETVLQPGVGVYTMPIT